MSIPENELAWAKTIARREHTSLSALLTTALRQERQARARRRVLDKLGIVTTAEERAAVRREWQA